MVLSPSRGLQGMKRRGVDGIISLQGLPGYEEKGSRWYYLPPGQLGQLYSGYTLKKNLPFAFFKTYQAFKRREGFTFRKIFTE